MSTPYETQYPEIDEVASYPWQGNKQGLDYTQIDPALHEEISHEPEVFLPENHEQQLQQDDDSDFLEGSDGGRSDDEEISDADSDTVAYRKGIEKFKDSVYKFRAEQRRVSEDEAEHDSDEVLYDNVPGSIRGRGRGRPRGRGRGRGRGRVKKGEPRPRGRQKGTGGPRVPRAPAQPTGEIKLRLHQANNAFLDSRLEDAKAMIFEIIRINAETFEAWVLLSEIWREVGDMNNFVTCRMYAAHLRPNHVDIWLGTAKTILEDTGQRHKFLQSADFCYTRAIAADPKNCVAARLAKAEVLKEWGGKNRRALDQYIRVLRVQPHDLEVMRLAAELYLDLDSPQAAIEMYTEAIAHFKSLTDADERALDWTDINIFVELHGYAKQYDEAIRSLKSLARWLLKRNDEDYWDDIVDDDREFDNGDDRRIEIANFERGRHDAQQYGLSLPLELRVKLGIYRLKLGHITEALLHLKALDPENAVSTGMILDYPDLYRDAADNLLEGKLYSEALRFFFVLQGQPEEDLAAISLALGKCYLGLHRTKDAEDCFESVLLHDEDNTDARMQLAKIYEKANDQEKAFLYVNEVMTIQRRTMPQNAVRTRKRRDRTQKEPKPKGVPRVGGLVQKTLTAAELKAIQEKEKAKDLQRQFDILQATQGGVEAGHEPSITAWMEAAKPLIDDFRSFRPFYPWDKYIGFKGYSNDTDTGATALDGDVMAMADRLAGQLNKDTPKDNNIKDLPTNYRGILFSTWLDIFLQYATNLCRRREFKESFIICEAAKDCTIWYNDKEAMFLINITHCTCAMLGNDEARCLQICRYFMTTYQFETDAYRLFSAISKLHKAPTQWYSASPTQKYILRQIRALDASITNQMSGKQKPSRAALTTTEEMNKPASTTREDVTLLILYGHILAVGGSHTYALNYFFRAYALDPNSPLLNLTIALSYIQYALKRQSENRQYHILQGMHFLHCYYSLRHTSPYLEERQEAHYVVGRAYHLLGLTHLAQPYYMKCLEEARNEVGNEELEKDVALNLQSMYMNSGNAALARKITEEWLVI